MLELKNVTKSYNHKDKAVNNLSLVINDGEIFGFLGHNGAGKTTTIKMITGIIEPDEGQIRINEKNISKESIEAKMQLGYVSDSPDAFLRLKGIEYLNFIADMYNLSWDIRKKRIFQYAEEFDMISFLNNRIQSYSHGMKQKLFIIGALIHNPKVLVLDEPLTGLDPKAMNTLKKVMRAHADNGNVVFFSTHMLDVAEKICDRIAIINNGILIYEGDLKSNVMDSGHYVSLENTFLELVNHETNI